MIQIGNGNWAVKEDNLLGFRYDETEGVYFPREMTFGRACDATRVNPDGLIERVPYNLLQQSNSFNTTWTKLNAPTITSGQSGYDGSSDAWLLESTSSGTSVLNQNINSSGYQTFSVYAKAGTANFLAFYNSAAITAFFNLSSGSVGTNNGISATIESIGGGWYRCSMAYDAAITYTRIYVTDADNNYNSAIGSNIYIQDAQLNEGSIKPYFPTTNRQDIARIDYSSGTGALLLEPQRTNVLNYSEQLDNAYWTKSKVSVTANAATSPDGTQNADKVISSSVNGSHLLYVSISASVSSGTTYTYSFFAKSAEYSKCGIRIGGSGYTTQPMSVIDLSDGSIEFQQGFSALSVEAFTNGWYRISGTYTATSSVAPNVIAMPNTYTTTSDNFTFAGNGTSGVYAWGLMHEQGSYPTSYIPTTSATVTRLADTCYKTGVADWIGQTEGTLFVDFIYKTSDQTRVSISDGSSTNWIFIGIPDSSTHSRLYIRTNGTVQVDTSSNLLGIFTSGQRYKIALAYKSGDWAIAVNGTIKTSGSQTFSPSAAFNTIVLTGNSSAASSQLGLNQINHATLYKTRLSNSELAALTTI